MACDGIWDVVSSQQCVDLVDLVLLLIVSSDDIVADSGKAEWW